MTCFFSRRTCCIAHHDTSFSFIAPACLRHRSSQQTFLFLLSTLFPKKKNKKLLQAIPSCVGVYILQFPVLGLFFLSLPHKVKTPSLWQSRNPDEGFVRTDPGPAFLQRWFFFKMYRSHSWLFLLRSHTNKRYNSKPVFFLFMTFS